jgi:quercetin dioxygenase-like cupin family protein
MHAAANDHPGAPVTRTITEPVRIEAAGTPPKLISEYIGRVASETDSVSVALMESPSGWSEPGQTPEFDEYTLVLDGELQVETRDGTTAVTAGQAIHAPAGAWVRYSSPAASGARYVAVCVPAFSPEAVHREE